MVEAGVDGEFTELFVFGVGAIHEQFAGAGGGGVHFVVEVYAGVARVQRHGADARRIQNRMITLSVHVLLHIGAFLSYLNQPCNTPTRHQPAAVICRFPLSHIDFSPYQFLAAGDARPAPETVH